MGQRNPHLKVPASPRLYGTTCRHSSGLTESDQIWCGNTGLGSVILGGQPHLRPKDRGPSVPRIFVTSVRGRTQYKKQHPNFAWWLDMRKIFIRWTTNADARSVCGTTFLFYSNTVYFVCVCYANLVQSPDNYNRWPVWRVPIAFLVACKLYL